jgi:dolichol kinase
MNQNLIYTLILACAFLLLFGLGELLYHKFSVKSEYTRKLVHLGTGVLSMLFPLLLSNHWFVLILCTSFLLILVLSLKFNLLQSINKINRKSYGSILYPIVVYILFLFYANQNELIYFYLPILILAVCDPVAALLGKQWPIGKFKILNETKTLIGSSAFFVSSFALSLIVFLGFGSDDLSKLIFPIALISLSAAIIEAVSQKGFDNLFIPVIVAGVMTLLVHFNLLTL